MRNSGNSPLAGQKAGLPGHAPPGLLRDLLRGLARACAWGRLRQALRDRRTWAAFVLGGAGLFFSPGPMPPLWRLACAALAEEATWRALLQREAEARWPGGFGGAVLTRGNILVSLLFAAAHAVTQPVLMAVLTFFPSLVLGALWTRHGSLWLCAGLHFWYNLVFFAEVVSS